MDTMFCFVVAFITDHDRGRGGEGFWLKHLVVAAEYTRYCLTIVVAVMIRIYFVYKYQQLFSNNDRV